MLKRRLFVVEKPVVSNYFKEHISENDVIILASSFNYKFDYQNISLKKAPYTQENPVYKNHFLHKNFYTFVFSKNNEGYLGNLLNEILELNKSGYKTQIRELSIKFLSHFDEIIYACDVDFTGIRGFDLKFSHYFNLGENYSNILNDRGIRLSFININNYLDKTISNGILERKSKLPKVLEIARECYIKKDFFEYNYNLNSLLFFNLLINKLSGSINNDFILTKNMIWSLFMISKEEPIKADFFIHKMEMNNIGSYASRVEIIEKLISLSLIQIKETEKYNTLMLSDIGNNLISFFHKKINDPYIGKRINEDLENLNLSKFIEKYEKYLYTVFSKQKRFQNKLIKDI